MLSNCFTFIFDQGREARGDQEAERGRRAGIGHHQHFHRGDDSRLKINLLMHRFPWSLFHCLVHTLTTCIPTGAPLVTMTGTRGTMFEHRWSWMENGISGFWGNPILPTAWKCAQALINSKLWVAWRALSTPDFIFIKVYRKFLMFEEMCTFGVEILIALPFWIVKAKGVCFTESGE